MDASSFFPFKAAAVWVIAVMATQTVFTAYSLDLHKAVATAVAATLSRIVI